MHLAFMSAVQQGKSWYNFSDCFPVTFVAFNLLLEYLLAIPNTNTTLTLEGSQESRHISGAVPANDILLEAARLNSTTY